jgi:purine-binding chemotaxis protein CheW
VHFSKQQWLCRKASKANSCPCYWQQTELMAQDFRKEHFENYIATHLFFYMNNQSTQTTSYLSFRLADEFFAAPVGKVLEILEVSRITKVPQCPLYMRGVINLRGSVLPVIDTRIKFGMPVVEDTVNTCIIVLNIEIDRETIAIGTLVDGVQEVLEIEKEAIKPAPSIGSKYKSEFIEGMVKLNEEFIMMLNLDKVFSSDELMTVKESTLEESTI